jgi:hypothetical protein
MRQASFTHRSASSSILLAIALLACAVALVGCGAKVEANPPQAVRVEKIEGSDLKKITLAQLAAERLGMETAEVERQDSGRAAGLVVPYAALLYDTKGKVWVYTNPEALVFVRAEVTVDHIAGDKAFLSDGPSVGTKVATVGVAELHGVEVGVGGGH